MPGSLRRTPQNDEVSPTRGVYLLTHPRSASNLFQTMMSKQPGFQHSSYHLWGSGLKTYALLDKGPISTWPEEERKALYEEVREGFEQLQDELSDAEKKGNKVFLKEHIMFLLGPDILSQRYHPGDAAPTLTLQERDQPPATEHTNPTSLPDHFLLSLQPIFQIRNPILTFPSMMRAERDVDTGIQTKDFYTMTAVSYQHHRNLYEWYEKHGGPIIPRIIDADDVMNDAAAVRKICLETGLDPDAVQYEWDTQEITDPFHARFLRTISTSKGIIPGLAAKGKDLSTEMAKWRSEFGDVDAQALARAIENSMEDYNFLYARRTVGV